MYKKVLSSLFLFLVLVSNVYAQSGNKVVVVPLFGDETTASQQFSPDEVTIFEKTDPNDPNATVLSGITYSAGAQIAIDTPDPMQPDQKIIRFAPTANGVRDNHQPSLGVNHIIALFGVFPSRSQSDPFIAQISMFGGNFAPRSWAFCDGQLLAISQNSALFSILGTTYGGDGRTSFGLPDLRGRTAVHPGTGPGLSPIRLGQRFGSPTLQL